MTCPRCQVQLTAAQHGSDWMYACGSCGGIWLQPASAQRLLAPIPDFAPSRSGSPALPCPQCRQPMAATYSPRAGVEIDSCPEHGVWFDHEEVTHVAQAIARLQRKPMPTVPGPSGAAAGIAAGAAAGVAVGGAAAALAAADALSTPQGQRTTNAVADAAGVAVDAGIETVAHGPGLIDAGSELADMASGVDVGDVVEVGGAVVEGAGGVLTSILDVLSGIFS